MLKIYKASAGSGKTFTLAVEYIKLLIINPFEYKHILAVTFTNKATAEMKDRIITHLNGIANDEKNSRQYFTKIKEYDDIKKLNISDDEIRRRAGIALTSLLHDYSRFRIETIDSFFQSVIRELAHELDLTANLRIDLNDNEVLEEAVDSIINELSTDKGLFNIIKTFIEDKTDDKGGNWHINAEVAQFGRNIFNEEYLEKGQEIREKIGNTEFLTEYKKTLRAIRDKAQSDITALGNKFLSTCEEHGYDVTAFSYGDKGIHNFFVKLSKGIIPGVSSRITSCQEDANKWAKDKKDATLASLVENTFMPMLNSTIEALPDLEVRLNSANAILRNINHLMLLNIINTKVRDLNQNANRFLLADTAHFLNDLIDKSDIPFIYEKMGTRFNHIMIDEFQDTSNLQWENFKPLISNSLDANEDCLIVGDVKQSIYRWRNSDWQILNNIESGEYASKIDAKPLDTNYRSAERIIKFNNSFFPKAVNALNEDYKAVHGEDSTDLLHAYSDVEQKFNEKMKAKGYVYIKAIKKIDGQSYNEEMLEEIHKSILNLMDAGVRPDDITILLRRNVYIPIICKYFNDLNADAENEDEKINIVSDEAFRLDFSTTINIIVTALRVLADESNTFSLAYLAYCYQKDVKHNKEITESLNDLFVYDSDKLKSWLPADFCKNMEQLTFLPLLELTERMYDIFELQSIPKQDAYLFYFHDQMSAYCEDNQSDISAFIQFWDENLHAKTIPNGAASGVKIMSIHKSKGLEFHSVIMPYCDWETGGKASNLLWCKPQEEPYNELPLAPVNFIKETDSSIFHHDYQQEVLKNDVDNLNLIYVGFTRAVNNLCILIRKPSEKKSKKGDKAENDKVTNISSLIIKSIPDTLTCEEDEEKESITWHWGNIEPSKEEKKEEDNIKAKFQYYDSIVNYRQSNKSAMFINEDEADSSSMSFIDRGLLYHSVLQQIGATDDVDAAIDKAVDIIDNDGCFDDESTREEVKSNLHRAFRNEQARKWFSSEWIVKNECDILFESKKGNTIERRPDRIITQKDNSETIVIDYKTGEENNKRYKEQVGFYMWLLQRMGYKNVKGYIWYVLDDKIEAAEQIKLDN
ncbi:MAG: UvrD-helicase domain-containing protein [Bacteroidaceae bacterium]|nr:UvrD-helicase domain-containing protein [Bacteroidaceae bacterium]